MNRPCEGLRVVEVAVGASDLGLGLAAGVPGMLLAELGADVTRIVGPEPLGIDQHLSWSRVWHRDKRIERTDDAGGIRELLAGADVALLYGPEELVEGRGLTWSDLAPDNPRLVLVRCAGDYGLLVEARSGFCTQLAGHRSGPIFVDVRATGSGAAFLTTASALALLHRRELTGEGGWADTSLYDGMLATLGCMIGRSERAPADVEGYWRDGSTFPNFLYRCADGELIQVWFGGKGMYPKLLEVLGDEPSENGYYADQVSGQLRERAERWKALFEAKPRDEWIGLLRAEGVACEPVNGPGDALSDPHLAEVGLARADGDDLVYGSPLSLDVLVAGSPVRDRGSRDQNGGGRPLAGLCVADFSAFVAGPLGAQVLADLGADVIKVEPPTGEAMRAAAYAVAACQRGKRSLALDIGADEARPAVEGLLRWADVVLHNFRVGVAERLGIGAVDVAGLRPDAVYCHASGFGPTGPRAKLPGNDALMQAVTGFEVAVGGEGNDPIAGTWIPIDMSGGWVAAIGMLAGLYARVRTGAGQRVDTSLLGAGMLLQSGTYQRGGEVVRGPHLDADQTGYGPGYRIFRCADDRWLAVVVPDEAAWQGFARVIGVDLPEYCPLRTGAEDDPAVAEATIAAALASRPSVEWLEPVTGAGVLVEVVEERTRDEFRAGILDDGSNRALGRVAAYDTADWGRLEQIGPLLRAGPAPWTRAPSQLPRIGEHTVEALRIAGLDDEAIDALLDAGVAAQHGG